MDIPQIHDRFDRTQPVADGRLIALPFHVHRNKDPGLHEIGDAVIQPNGMPSTALQCTSQQPEVDPFNIRSDLYVQAVILIRSVEDPDDSQSIFGGIEDIHIPFKPVAVQVDDALYVSQIPRTKRYSFNVVFAVTITVG